jgi:REP element-mobilizing transposase RayT
METRPFQVAKPPSPRHGLPEIVRAFKSFSARRVNALRCTCSVPVWQRNYYEHIVRDHDECGRIRQYIENNPEEWDRDIENPTFPRRGGS